MAEKKVIEIEIQDNSKTLKQQYKEAVLEVQKLADAFGATSIEVQNASKKAAELKEQIEDVNDAIQSQKGEGAFIALGKSVSAVANGFSAVQGAMGLVGVESEEVQQAMLRVQSAMALAQGLEGLEDAGRSFRQLKSVVTSFGTTAVNAFKSMSTASKAFLVTGIGLLIAGIGLAIANWDKLKSAMTNQTATQKILNEVMLQSSDAIKGEVSASEKLSKQLQDENLTREQKIEKVKQFQKDYPGLISNMTVEKGSLIDINNELVTNIKLLKLQSDQKAIEALRAEKLQEKLKIQLDLQKEAQEHAGEFTLNLGSSANNGWVGFSSGAENAKLATMEVTKVVTDGTKAIDKQIKSLDNASKQTEKSIDRITKAGGKSKEEVTKQDTEAEKKAQEIEDKRKARIEAANQLRKAELAQIKEFYKTAKAENEARLRTEQEQEEFLINEKYKTEIALFKKYGKDTAELEIAQLNEINEIRLKYQQKDYDAKEASRQLEIQAIKDANQNRIELEDKQFEVMQSIGQTEKEKEIADLVKSYEEKFAIVGDNNVLEKELTEQQKKDLAVIEEKYRKTQAEKDKEAQEKANQLQQQRVDLILKYAQTFGQAMSSLNGLLNANDEERLKNVKQGSKEEDDIKRKMFERDKKLRIVQTVIDTASNIVTSVRNGGGIPTGIPFGIAAATMGALQIAAISKTSYGSGNNTVPSVDGGVIAPNLNVVGDTGINQLATLQQQPVKAYVVSNDITSAQQFDLKVQQTASL